MDSNTNKDTPGNLPTIKKPNDVQNNNMTLRLETFPQTSISTGIPDGKGNLVFNNPNFAVKLNVLNRLKPGQRVSVAMSGPNLILIREVTGEFKILFGQGPNVPFSATSSTPEAPSSDAKKQNETEPDWKNAMSAVETKILERTQRLEDELKSLKSLVMSQNQEKPQKEQETDPNFNNPFCFEVPLKKKIKLEDQSDEIQKLNQTIKDLKEDALEQTQIINNLREDNLSLHRQIGDLKYGCNKKK